MEAVAWGASIFRPTSVMGCPGAVSEGAADKVLDKVWCGVYEATRYVG